VVVGDAALEDALLRVPGYESLHLLPSGPIPPNPSELLGNVRATEIFRSLAQNADLVIVDSPPVMPVTDASVLAASVDGVLVVVVAGSTTRKDVKRSLETLGRVGARVVGMVLNKAPEADSYGYYRYGYSAKSTKAPPQQASSSHFGQNGSSNGSDPERIPTRRERRSG
jgi:capsular exopolysaccharide synthesis family protein